MQILLVEDDASLANGLRTALTDEGFVVNHVDRGRAAVQIAAERPPDIVILDLGLPDMDGLAVLKAIRRRDPRLPVLLVTARATLSDKVTGLGSGADDYVAKPFDIPELIARIRVIERRLSTSNTYLIKIGDVEMDTLTHQVLAGEKPVSLPRREFMLLKALMENSGRVLTRSSLEDKLYEWGEEISSNAIEVHIHFLRRKFGNEFIKTIRGVGYTIPKP